MDELGVKTSPVQIILGEIEVSSELGEMVFFLPAEAAIFDEVVHGLLPTIYNSFSYLLIRNKTIGGYTAQPGPQAFDITLPPGSLFGQV